MKENNLTYLDTYVLQKDMRLRLPKSILENTGAERGKTKFKIFLNKKNNEIILKAKENCNLQ